MRILVFLLVVIGLIGCAQRAPRPAKINHVVFIKLQDPSETETLIRDCDERLGRIPSVHLYSCGTHYDIGRDGINSDYDVGLYVGFNTEEEYRFYLDHPDHVGIVTDWRPKFEWIQIYDIGDETK